MPRDANGNFTLPAGNPVVTGTTIESAWSNTTMDDIKQGLTDSLDRYGRGGMQAPFRFVDGTAGAPGMSWASELSTGFYRAGAADMRATVAGVPQMRWTGTGVDVWDSVGAAWLPLTGAAGGNFALLNASNVFTQPQRITNAGSAYVLFKDATPTKAARFSLNLSATDYASLDYFTGTDWFPFLQSNILVTNYYANDHVWRSSGGTRYAEITASGNFTVGSASYAPTNPGASFIGRYVGVANTIAEIGVFANDGFAGPRAGLFAYGDGAATGVIGLDWTFSNGVTAFQFRRAGVPIFNYNQDGVAIINGTSLDVYASNNSTYCRLRVDPNSAVYWNSFGGATNYQWYLNSALLATMQANAMAFGGTTGDYRLSGPTASGAISFRSDPSTTNRGLSLGSIDNSGTFFPAFQIGDFVPGVARFLNGLILQVFNGANNWSGGLNVPVGNNASAMQYVENGSQRGGMLWHNDASYRYGGIFVSTSAAPGTGGTPGQIWLQV